MVKCKRCDQDDLVWDTNYNESTGKWRLWNPSTERPHECSKKKETPEQTYSGRGYKKDKLWKKDWKPIMDVKSHRVCGICRQECITVEDCEYCENFKQNPCNEWCPKCKEHPRVIYVEKDPQALKEFYEKFPEEKNNKEEE